MPARHEACNVSIRSPKSALGLSDLLDTSQGQGEKRDWEERSRKGLRIRGDIVVIIFPSGAFLLHALEI